MLGLGWSGSGSAWPSYHDPLSGAVVLASLWFVVDPDAWRIVDNPYGMVRGVAVSG